MKTENKQNIRKCDAVGRVMLPYKLRESLNIKEKDALKLEIKNEKIVITKA